MSERRCLRSVIREMDKKCSATKNDLKQQQQQ